MKYITLVGYKGNMGRRYASILDYLGITWYGVDINDKKDPHPLSEGIIIATPTESHPSCIAQWSRFNLPILCEKPVCRTKDQLDYLLKTVAAPLQMINQYKFYSNYQEIDKGESTQVNYYNTGTDGLVWDCINLIGLAKEDVHLYNTSPIWKIMLNGTFLDKRFIDNVYIDNIETWANNPIDGKEYIKHAHNRIFEYEKNTSSNSYPGTPIFLAAPRQEHKKTGWLYDSY
jgi:hypothetical protein